MCLAPFYSCGLDVIALKGGALLRKTRRRSSIRNYTLTLTSRVICVNLTASKLALPICTESGDAQYAAAFCCILDD